MSRKPKTKPAKQPVAELPDKASQAADWLEFKPRADYRLIAWDSDEESVEVALTSDEYIKLRAHLAKLRGIALEANHAI